MSTLIQPHAFPLLCITYQTSPCSLPRNFIDNLQIIFENFFGLVISFSLYESIKFLTFQMGTNRRSRRRSAARILNPSMQIKRPKKSPELEDDSDEDNFPPFNSPATSPNITTHTPNIDSTNASTTTSSITLERSPIDNIVTNQIGPVDNANPTFTSAEICSFELMDLLDNAGCPLNTYERVVCLLRRQEKIGFSYSQAHSRDKLLSILRQKFHCPSIQSTIISKSEVFSFPFTDMLQDLVDTAWEHVRPVLGQRNAGGFYAATIERRL